MSQNTTVRERAELCPETSKAKPLEGQSVRHPQETTYIPALNEPEAQPKMQRIKANHGVVMIGDKKRAIIFRDDGSRESYRRTQQVMALCERYDYDVLVIDAARNEKEYLLDRTARDFLRMERGEALISLQTPQLNRAHTQSWLFSANTNMALDVAKNNMRLMADTHVHAPYTQKKLNQKTDLIAVTTHERLAGDAVSTVLTAPYLIVAIHNAHARQLIQAYGTAHAMVHGGHHHDCERMNEMAAGMTTKVAVFHPDPPKRLASAGKISLAALRNDNAMVVTNPQDMLRALKDLSRPTGGAPVSPQRPGTRNGGGSVHAPQFL